MQISRNCKVANLWFSAKICYNFEQKQLILGVVTFQEFKKGLAFDIELESIQVLTRINEL